MRWLIMEGNEKGHELIGDQIEWMKLKLEFLKDLQLHRICFWAWLSLRWDIKSEFFYWYKCHIFILFISYLLYFPQKELYDT